MSSSSSPSFANLFLGRLEERFLSNRSLKPILWCRFIDNIFMLWPHDKETLNTFISTLHTSSSLSFTYAASTSEIIFENRRKNFTHFHKLLTLVHIKPTNKQQYVHYNSCHAFHTKRSLSRSLSIRGHGICNNPDSLDKFLSNLHTSPLQGGTLNPFVCVCVYGLLI
jgi:hypothetical protein